MDIKKIKAFSKSISEEFINVRQYLHQNPELSFEEINTTRFIENKLKEIGINNIQKISETGIIANIIIDKSLKTIALRADIDALPIVEKNIIEYKSKNEGVMHACGHDVHASCLLGVAKLLIENKSELKGNVKLIFQHAEEKLPGGAFELIEKGVLKNPDVDLVIAQHVDPALNVGSIGIKSGKYMASTDEIYLKIFGKGGHAAIPHEINDTVLAASTLIVNLQQVVSRKANAGIPTVLSFGKFIANGATNIIPNEVNIEGTFRTMNEEWRKLAHEEIKNICYSISNAMSVECELTIKKGYPALFNTEIESQNAYEFAKEYFGEQNAIELPIRMTAEDFSYFTNDTRGFLYRLGVRNEKKGIINPLHSPNFDIDSESISHGIGYMSYLVFKFFEKL